MFLATFFFLLNFISFFICLHWVFVVACGVFFAVSGLSCIVAHGILVSRPGIEPASPALEGSGLLTTEPPGKFL